MEETIRKYEAVLYENGYNKTTINVVRGVIRNYLQEYGSLDMRDILEYDKEHILDNDINIAYHLRGFLDWTNGLPAPRPGEFNGSSTGRGRPRQCLRDCTYKSRYGRCRCKPLDVLDPIPNALLTCPYYEKMTMLEKAKRQGKRIYDRIYHREVSYMDSHSAVWK